MAFFDQSVKGYKYGVLYCKAGQTNEEEMFSNSTHSRLVSFFLSSYPSSYNATLHFIDSKTLLTIAIEFGRFHSKPIFFY
jgi:hypothetical protein